MRFQNFALIGHPVGHSMSPFLHSRLFALAGSDAYYEKVDIPPEKLAAWIPRLRELDGFNITIPHKQAIIPLLDACSPKAAESGSVNTVKSEGGRLTGYTTDGTGFRRALEAAGIQLGGKIAVLGAGGAAMAIAFEAAHAGASVTVASREHSAGAAERLCADLRANVPGCRASHCLIPELRGTWDILANATPAGMLPHPETCAAPEEVIENSSCVFDAVYIPCETKLLALAKRHGKKAVGGAGMLVYQAAAAEEIWLGARFSDSSLAGLREETSLEIRKKSGNIILCGFMGCGKTTCGRLLAGQMGRKFLDLDEFIEQRESMTISAIFAKKGEPAFRAMEKQAVQEFSRTGGLVVAAGGGTLMQKENADALRANGVLVLLDASPETVGKRLKGDLSRPLLNRGSGPEAMERLYRERVAACRAAADFTVNADGTAEAVVKAVAAALALSD